MLSYSGEEVEVAAATMVAGDILEGVVDITTIAVVMIIAAVMVTAIMGPVIGVGNLI